MAEPIREQTDTEQKQRAQEAKFLLTHPMIESAFQALETHYMNRWLNSDLQDVKGREWAFRMFKCQGQFRGLLTKYLEDGTLVEIAEAQEVVKKRRLDEE